MDRLYIPVIKLHLSIVAKKHSIATITQLRSLELLTAKIPLLHMLNYMNWLTHDLFGWCVSSWWPLFPSRSSVLIYMYIYIYMHFLYELCYMTYIYIQQECHSVLVKLHPITFYETVFLGSAQFLGWMPLFCFLWFTNCVLLSEDNSLIPGCLWLLAFISNNTLILGIWCSTIPHLPRCFCP